MLTLYICLRGAGAGLYGHDQQDINLFFKDWGFDFLKVDFCGGQDQRLDEKKRYTAIRKAMDKTGKKNLRLNVCRWKFPGTWVTGIADSWRIFADIKPEWRRVCEIIDENTYLAPYASPGHYNDMDMLEVGRGLSPEEDKAHFSMWCLLGSPLMLGNDLTEIPLATMSVISNRELIAVNQDITGDVQGRLIAERTKDLQVWAKRINGKLSKELVVVFFNRTTKPASMDVNLNELDLRGPAKIRDLWEHIDTGQVDSIICLMVPPHGVRVLKISDADILLQEDYEAEYAWINNFNLIQYGQVLPWQGKVEKEKRCSGGAKVCWLGNGKNNFIEFRKIIAPKSGNYLLTVHYICSNPRNALLTINGKKKVMLKNLCSYDWKKVATTSLMVYLDNGENEIRILNAHDWLPDIDKIHLNLRSPLH